MNPIRRRPCADPVQKHVPGERITQKGIDSSRPVTEARMERSEIRDSRDAGPGLRFAPSGLRSCCDLPVGRLVGTARSHILADFADTRARRKPLKPLRAGTSGDSGVLVVTRVRSTTTKCTRGRGCNGIRRSPRPLWAEDFSTARAHRAARSQTYV